MLSNLPKIFRPKNPALNIPAKNSGRKYSGQKSGRKYSGRKFRPKLRQFNELV
jgi:hypothetical protein